MRAFASDSAWFTVGSARVAWQFAHELPRRHDAKGTSNPGATCIVFVLFVWPCSDICSFDLSSLRLADPRGVTIKFAPNGDSDGDVIWETAFVECLGFLPLSLCRELVLFFVAVGVI